MNKLMDREVLVMRLRYNEGETCKEALYTGDVVAETSTMCLVRSYRKGLFGTLTKEEWIGKDLQDKGFGRYVETVERRQHE